MGGTHRFKRNTAVSRIHRERSLPTVRPILGCERMWARYMHTHVLSSRNVKRSTAKLQIIRRHEINILH